jgi:hypothetical protein
MTRITHSIERRIALRGPSEIVAWLLAVGALIGAVVTEGAGTSLLHAVLFTSAFILLLGIVIRRRMHGRRDGRN